MGYIKVDVKSGVVELPSFKASISTQGKDKHIHLPRKLYGDFKENKILDKKFNVEIKLVPIDEII